MMLTVWDTLFIINGGIFMIHQSMAFESKLFNTLFPNLIFPMAGMSMTGNVFKLFQSRNDLKRP